MRPGRQAEWVGDLERIFAGNAVPLEDRALLDGFIRHRDEAAFEALVVRHGPMVRGVCRRVLREAEDVDDAFQATFLVLFLKARRIGDADRLSPWLFGVATRVARKARVRAARRQARLGSGVVPVAMIAPARDPDRFELPPLIDAEIARLPTKLRAAVVLCLVEGTTPDEASRRLGCPVGTVKSRLARGRATLRARLTRRGVAPAVALATLDQITPAPLSFALIRATLAASRSPTIATTLLALTQGVAPAMITKSTAVAALLLGGAVLAGGEFAFHALKRTAEAGPPALAANPGSPRQPQPAPEPDAPQIPAPTTDSKPADQPLSERFAAIKTEYAAQQEVMRQATAKAKNDREEMDLYSKFSPDDVIYSRRMVDLAVENPTDPTARDALIWVIDKPYRSDSGAYGDEFARAAALLVRHHGDDPIAVSAGIGLENTLSQRRDTLLFGFLAAAKGREAKGIARLAMARYLATKVNWVRGAREHPGRHTSVYHGVIGDDGKPYDKQVEQSDDEYAYQLRRALEDPDAVQVEAERLYHEVINDFGDVPLSQTPNRRKLEALLLEPTPSQNGQPLTTAEIDKIRKLVAWKPTLGSIAENYLDEMQNIIPGKPAPAIDGVDLDGKPLKLADYRGKVVVLVFWGSWCGPCIREMSYERELNAKYQGRPFALLGVNCNDTKEAAQKVIAAERVTWPNFHDGHDGDGPIVQSYHIRGYPSSFVIDAQGIIRHKRLSGQELDDAVAKLLDEMKPPADAR